MASENNEESSIKKKIEDALDDDKIEEGKEKVKDFVGMNNSDKDESDKKRNSVMTVQSEEESIVSSTKGVHGSNSIEGKQSDSRLNDSNMSVNGSKSTLNNSNLSNNDSNMTVNGSNSKLNDSKMGNNNMSDNNSNLSDNNSNMSDNNSVNKKNMMGGVINKQPSKENSLNNSKESLNSKEGSKSKESLNSKEGSKSKESLNYKGGNSKSVSFAENDEVVEVNSYVPTTLLYPVEDSEVLKYREKDMIICEGFAFKKRPICCCLWHQKYFVLLRTGKLVYHKCDGSRPAKGDWNTLDCEAEKGISYNASHPYRLLLSNGIILGFDIEEDRNYWFTMITRHKQMIKDQSEEE